jgi:hypothetical protein
VKNEVVRKLEEKYIAIKVGHRRAMGSKSERALPQLDSLQKM